MEKKKILIVDDDETNINFVRRILEEYGYQFITADNGLDGFIVWENKKDEINLIITDLNMPWMNGKELIQKIRDSGSEVKIILMSGDYTEERALKNGADAFVSKLYLFEHLKDKVTALLT